MENQEGLNGPKTSTETVESDYGSDIDDDTWESVLIQAESHPLREVALDDLEDKGLVEHGSQSQLAALRLPRSEKHSDKIFNNDESNTSSSSTCAAGQASVNGARDETKSLSHIVDDSIPNQPVSNEEDDIDSQSPLQRFRTPPKKPLSVTDFVSPAWCELQYWYSLTRYGRVRRTPAMKAGTKIHKEKEREVHVEVPIEICTREDNMGLRLWNIIHGLRTLRLHGLTRELEVIGLIDGELVIGIIDEITTTCPDQDSEAASLGAGPSTEAVKSKKRKKKRDEVIPADQRTMKDFIGISHARDAEQQDDGPQSPHTYEQSITYYLVDIKTRKTKSIPPDRQTKPTRIQLMLYHQMLSELARNTIEAQAVFQRYQLDSEACFSDTFIAELANMNDNSIDSPDGQGTPTDSLDEITSHNTLDNLWTLMIEEFHKTFGTIDDLSSVISPLLTAEYRDSTKGNLLGKKSFTFDAELLDAHVKSTLSWWRGERQAVGVEIEDAWKCSICEFAESCTWRAEKVEQATNNARMRKASGVKAGT